MHKNALIFHGTGGNPDVCWYRWLGSQLEAKGYTVAIPFYPTINKEPIESFLPAVLTSHAFIENTVLIGHSGGAALLLALLEHLTVRIDTAILVAGYATPPNDKPEPVLQPSYNWEAIRSHAKELFFINSRSDPYGCDDKQGRLLLEKLGGTQIVRDDGHFGDYNQEYPTFELLTRLVP
jgi:predicted alpha/beta hydrolase family esterase